MRKMGRRSRESSSRAPGEAIPELQSLLLPSADVDRLDLNMIIAVGACEAPTARAGAQLTVQWFHMLIMPLCVAVLGVLGWAWPRGGGDEGLPNGQNCVRRGAELEQSWTTCSGLRSSTFLLVPFLWSVIDFPPGFVAVTEFFEAFWAETAWIAENIAVGMDIQ